MQRLISENLKDVLVAQWAHESYNSHLYLRFISFLKSKGLDNLSEIFKHQYDEEKEHAEMIFNFLMDMNEDFIPPVVESIKENISSFSDMAGAFLAREILTTQSLAEIRDMTMVEECVIAEEFIRKMIYLQQAEYSEATMFLDKVSGFGEDQRFMSLWDSSFEME